MRTGNRGQNEPGKGLPIGNLNSQFFANVYLNGLDQFVKHRLRCRHYLRYCDDFVLLSPDRDELLYWRRLIERYLDAELSLALNPRERLRPVSDGVDFLGLAGRGIRPVRNVLTRASRFLAGADKRSGRGCKPRPAWQAGVVTYRFDAADLDRLQAVLASSLGHFKRANAFTLWQTLWRQHAWLAVYFAWDAASHRLQPRWRMPKALTNVRAQSA